LYWLIFEVPSNPNDSMIVSYALASADNKYINYNAACISFFADIGLNVLVALSRQKPLGEKCYWRD